MAEIEKLEHAPKDARSFRAIATYFDALDLPSSKAYKLVSALLKLPGSVRLISNGSFHAYNINIEYVTAIKKWNPYNEYPKYARYVTVASGVEARDSDVLFLAPEEYDFFIEKQNINDMSLLDETEISPQQFQPEEAHTFPTAAEYVDFLEKQKIVASKLWTASKKGSKSW